MKKIFCFALAAFLGLQCFSQTKEVVNFLYEISNNWVIDTNNNVAVRQYIEVPNTSKNVIMNKVKNYFIYKNTYLNIQEIDRENGIIIAKGIFDSIYVPNSQIKHSFPYVIKVNSFENRAFVEVIITNWCYFLPIEYTSLIFSDSEMYMKPITEMYPINSTKRTISDNRFKTVEGYAFYKSIKEAFNTIEKIKNEIIH